MIQWFIRMLARQLFIATHRALRCAHESNDKRTANILEVLYEVFATYGWPDDQRAAFQYAVSLSLKELQGKK